MEQVLQSLNVEPRIQREEEETYEMPRPALRFLEHIASHPLLSITERFDGLERVMNLD
jgi:hypothetical protein